MTSLGPRFCPRCGTARVADMPFCPACGLNVAEFDERAQGGAGHPATATDVAGGTSTAPAGTSQISSVGEWAADPRSDPALPTSTGRSVDRGFRVPPIAIVALIVVAGVIALGLVTGPQLGGSPGAGGPPASTLTSGAPAPIVGLTLLIPTDGQAVSAKDVVVIGTAPPGLTITQDISFGFDQHATVDGTGHWAITVGLNEGDNKLTFRIGDDHSTQKTIRVIYTPPHSP
jgi:hypothetical protein